MFGFRVLGVAFLICLCALALSPVFEGGLNGATAISIPVPRLPFPNNTDGNPFGSFFNSTSRVGYTHPNVSLPPPRGDVVSAGGRLVLPDWLGYALLAAIGVGGAFIMFFRGKEAAVYDISESISLLEESSKRFSSRYGAAKLGALAEYYRHLRDLCLRLGIREEPWEAPAEFLDRVALSMSLDRVEARMFAEVFCRSRYSKGINAEEEAALSHFMAAFLEAVKRRTQIGV